MITKDGRDTPIERLTAENYIVPKGEEKDYHAVIEVTQYDARTGRKLSKPRLQKFGKKTFERTVQHILQQQGYTITILHNPNDWLKAKAEEAKKKAEEAAAAKAKAEKEAFDKAVAEAVKKELAAREAKGKGKGKKEDDAPEK